LGIYPEGTRSPDGRLYRGRTGVARLAMESGAPIVPVAMFNTADIQPTGKVLPKIMRVKMIFGEPMYFPTSDKSNDPEELRKATDAIMKKLQEMSGQEYVDIYASQAKEALAEEKKRSRESDDEEEQ
jgi:1-acyl-sn-glycerol-3-phosphate acyltransferase